MVSNVGVLNINQFGSGLRGLWHLEDTTDSSGNGGTLTLVNAPSHVTGKFANGLDLEASSTQSAYAADSVPLSITGNMSISAWINIESLPGSGATYGIVTKFNATGNQRSFLFRLFNDGGTQKVEATIDQTGTSTTVDTGYWTPTLNTGTWYHLVLTVTPGNASASTFELFINGVSQGNGTMSASANAASIYDGTAPLYISASAGGGAGAFDGIIDEVAIYSTILTPSQIKNYYSWATGKMTKIL